MRFEEISQFLSKNITKDNTFFLFWRDSPSSETILYTRPEFEIVTLISHSVSLSVYMREKKERKWERDGVACFHYEHLWHKHKKSVIHSHTKCSKAYKPPSISCQHLNAIHTSAASKYFFFLALLSQIASPLLRWNITKLSVLNWPAVCCGRVGTSCDNKTFDSIKTPHNMIRRVTLIHERRFELHELD